MVLRGSLVAGLAIAAVVSLAAQQPPAQAPADRQPAATFRVQVNYVEIDAIVTDREGRFVRGLTKDDFQVLEAGKPQGVTSFSFVDVPLGPVEQRRPVMGGPAVEPDVSSNVREFQGRLFLLVLDDLQTGLSRTTSVRSTARRFIEQHVGAGDLVAIVQTGGSAFNQDFTTSRQRLLAAVEGFAGRKLRSATAVKLEARAMGQPVSDSDPDPEDAFRAADARRSLASLKAFCDYLGGIRGRRKVLVYLGEGIDFDLQPRVRLTKDGKPAGSADITRDVRGMHEALQEVLGAATRNNVSIYGIDPRGLSTGADEAISMPGIAAATTSASQPPAQAIDLLRQEMTRSHDLLRTVTEGTGGAAFLNTNDPGAGLARIIAESSSYYILGYDAPDRADGRFRPVEVRVERPGLQVRARKGYFARSTKAAAPGPPRGNMSPELLDTIQSPLPVSGLRFSIAAVPFRSRGSRASVAMIIEIEPSRLAFAERSGRFTTDVELQILAVEVASGRRYGSHHVSQLRLRPAAHEAVARAGVRVTRRLELPPGRYRVQVGARDATSGAVGSVFSDLDVPDLSAGSLQMSGMALASASATRTPTVNDDRELDAALPGAPTTRREFPSHDTLAVFTEIYIAGRPDGGDVALQTTVTSREDGRVAFTARERRAEGGTWAHRTRIPLTGLTAGRYVLRVEATRGSAAVARAVEFLIR